MTAVISASPLTAVARRSICAKRSSRPSPRRPRTVSLRPAAATNRPNAAMMPSPMRPIARCPPSQAASKTKPPKTRHVAGRSHAALAAGWRPTLTLVIEHLLYRDAEVPGEGHGERQRRRVPLVLYRVDRLPGHAHRPRQLALSHVLGDPQPAHPVLHPCRLAGAETARAETARAQTVGEPWWSVMTPPSSVKPTCHDKDA